jgi:endonuclease YncB( thermonuclease family)
MSAMEQASRIISVLLGLAVMVLLLWPVTVPVGFGEAWWASRQAQLHRDTPTPPKPIPAWQALPQPKTEAAAPQAGTEVISPASQSTPLAHHAVAPNAGPAPKPADAPTEQPTPAQLAALKDQNQTGAVTPQAETKRYYRVTVRDGGTLQSGKVVIQLSGIAARDADATCKDDQGKTWHCGLAAKAALARLIHGRAVTCELPKTGEHNIFLARCTVAGTDLSTWLVRQGWATPREPSETALAEAAAAAKSEKLGLWRSAE